MNALPPVHIQPRTLIRTRLVQSIDLNFELLSILGGDVTGRLADVMLDLENFRLFSGDLDSRRPATHRIDQARVLCWLRRLPDVGAGTGGTCKGSDLGGVSGCRRASTSAEGGSRVRKT